MSLALAESQTWPDEVVQLLDDHHLVICADDAAAAARFGETLARRLGHLSETQVVIIDGRRATDVTSFCKQIEKQIIPAPQRRQLPQARSWWRDIRNVIDLLRTTRRAPKRRYFIWSDAHALLERDGPLFSRLVNALLGAAAEQEHITPDSLVLQRAVFIGSGPALAEYAERPDGQFQRWLDEEGSPFWEVASIMHGPPVLTYRLEGAERGG